VKNCLIDLDGTVYRGETPIAHARAFVEYLERIGRKYLFVTNCPLKGPQRIAARLGAMGIDARGKVLTSGMVALRQLARDYPGKSVYAIGSPDFLELLARGGVRLSFADPDIVLVGYDPDFTYAKMEAASAFILRGAVFLGTNTDATIPHGSATIPHTGAILASIAAATGKIPLCFGKPSAFMLDAALEEMGCGKEDCAVIGDRLDTDILFAVSNGIPGYLVLTGSSTRETLRDSLAKGGIAPTLVVEDLRELIARDSEGGL
jgi:HAD superfamily hydrolase (TIGR01450 family)